MPNNTMIAKNKIAILGAMLLLLIGLSVILAINFRHTSTSVSNPSLTAAISKPSLIKPKMEGTDEETIDAYKQAIKLDPNDSAAFFGLGSTYLILRRYQEAIDTYKQAIKLDPDNSSPHFMLGIAYVCIRNKSMAFEEYKILKSLDPAKANELFDQIYKD